MSCLAKVRTFDNPDWRPWSTYATTTDLRYSTALLFNSFTIPYDKQTAEQIRSADSCPNTPVKITLISVGVEAKDSDQLYSADTRTLRCDY